MHLKPLAPIDTHAPPVVEMRIYALCTLTVGNDVPPPFNLLVLSWSFWNLVALSTTLYIDPGPSSPPSCYTVVR